MSCVHFLGKNQCYNVILHLYIYMYTVGQNEMFTFIGKLKKEKIYFLTPTPSEVNINIVHYPLLR